jgi:hypothetical protein
MPLSSLFRAPLRQAALTSNALRLDDEVVGGHGQSRPGDISDGANRRRHQLRRATPWKDEHRPARARLYCRRPLKSPWACGLRTE